MPEYSFSVAGQVSGPTRLSAGVTFATASRCQRSAGLMLAFRSCSSPCWSVGAIMTFSVRSSGKYGIPPDKV
ncbi:MAG TPA: hypothetical protein EYG15_13450 [Deltaproteobacteria bacterium]|nr:hypothetical protein [Deltaproteobacteria bacterium]